MFCNVKIGFGEDWATSSVGSPKPASAQPMSAEVAVEHDKLGAADVITFLQIRVFKIYLLVTDKKMIFAKVWSNYSLCITIKLYISNIIVKTNY